MTTTTHTTAMTEYRKRHGTDFDEADRAIQTAKGWRDIALTAQAEREQLRAALVEAQQHIAALEDRIESLMEKKSNKNIAWSAWQAAQQLRAPESSNPVAICPRCACIFDVIIQSECQHEGSPCRKCGRKTI